MKEFKSWQSYWHFEDSVTKSNRYCWDADVQQFLDVVRETSVHRVFKIPKDRYLWRAQLGCEWDEWHSEDGEVVGETPIPYPPSRMIPLMHEAREGRANPKGIPYLYLANNQDTASSEVRPWLGSYITTAEFLTKRDLSIVDCSKFHDRTFIHLDEPKNEQKVKTVWSHIDRAFSRPTTDTDRAANYAPTQIIAELFKSEGYDGLAYKSALSDGYNVALFDVELASIGKRFVSEVEKVDFTFKNA